MYTLSITNNFVVTIGGGIFAGPPLPPNTGYRGYDIAPNGGKETIQDVSSFVINIPSMGNVLLLDLGTTKLTQYTNPKLAWTELPLGGLVRYRSLDAYFRYQGKGQVNLVVDRYGSVNVKFPQGGMVVSIDDLTAS